VNMWRLCDKRWNVNRNGEELDVNMWRLCDKRWNVNRNGEQLGVQIMWLQMEKMEDFVATYDVM
jgi:hypothetical protein